MAALPSGGVGAGDPCDALPDAYRRVWHTRAVIQRVSGISMPLRTLIAASALGLALACIAGSASAQQVYRWKDANGVIHFSQLPPANGVHYTKVHLIGEPEVSSHPAPSDPGNNRAAPTAEATTRAVPARGTQPATPSNRATLCKRLGSNIELLQSKQPVITSGSNGKQMVMSDNQREQQLATARAQQKQYCTSQGT